MNICHLRIVCLSVAIFVFTGCSSGGSGNGSGGSSSSSSSSSSTSGSSSSGSAEPKFFGTAPGGPEDYEHLLTYFNQVTPENAGKWGSVEATRDVMNWTDLDEAHTFAQNNGLPFKYHTLLWGQQQPDFMNDAGGLTDEERLAEIDEWMAAVAERYPDLELIEVINEPLHAAPEYTEALDGDLATCDALDSDGVTCWDWVIAAFEMAREHFPNAQLILNDYQILHLPEFTADYLEIINLLMDRDLIDAIGVQAHFLERTQAAMVQTNLDTLAETGLPIYVSEFDLNLQNNEQQANVMRDLFTVFWEHPAVVGVTHWGHLEDSVWREDAYLLRADGTERPALEWLVCYLAGNGDSCAVPDYVPVGWPGDEFGVTLQAELYDKGEGLVALGDVVAYTNPGDWIVFKSVEFQDGWDKLWVTYARGLDEDNGATITVHLDDLENAPVETIPVPYTGGWGSFDTLEIEWTPIATTEDVYIRFNVDNEAVANVDNIRFGRSQPVSDINLVGDGGFEGASVDGGWGPFGNSSVFTLTDTQAYAGAQSLQITGRTGTGGYAGYWLTDKVSTGTTYAVSLWVMHDGASDDAVTLASKVACEGEADAYTPLQSNGAVVADTWTKLSGNLVIPDGCDINEAQIYLEHTDPANTVYLDEVKVAPLNFVGDGGFEGIALDGGWSAFSSDTVLSLSAVQSHAGSQSMLAERNTGTGGFAAYNLTDVMTPGLTYLASAWAYQTGAGADTVRMMGLVKCNGEADDYQSLDNNTAVQPNTWTQLSVNPLSIPLDCDITEVQLYFEGTTAGVDVYIDDVSVTLPADNLVNGGDFEGASVPGGWETWWTGGTSLSVTAAKAYAGSQSLLASSRVANSSPSYNLTSLVEPDTTYSVSAQALHTGGANDALTLTYKLACNGEGDVYGTLASALAAAPDTWTELSNSMTIPGGCDVTEARIYFEGTTAGVDVYIDEVSVVAQ